MHKPGRFEKWRLIDKQSAVANNIYDDNRSSVIGVDVDNVQLSLSTTFTVSEMYYWAFATVVITSFEPALYANLKNDVDGAIWDSESTIYSLLSHATINSRMF